MKNKKNIPASVRQRLLNRAKRDQRPFNELVQYYAMERFLFRLSQSAHAGNFILKGALMLRVWRSPEFRSTMDIDMLGRTSNEEASIVAQIREIIAVDVEPDGLTFEPESIQSERITEDADYKGVRIRFRGRLDSTRVNVQVDLGFGDIIYPGPEELDLPTMLDSPVPRLLCYSRESAIAEKFEAIRLTFQRRGTAVPLMIEAFEQPFIDSKQVQWSAFCKRLRQDHVPESFKDVVSVIERFLAPLTTLLLSQDTPKAMTWRASGPWT